MPIRKTSIRPVALRNSTLRPRARLGTILLAFAPAITSCQAFSTSFTPERIEHSDAKRFLKQINHIEKGQQRAVGTVVFIFLPLAVLMTPGLIFAGQDVQKGFTGVGTPEHVALQNQGPPTRQNWDFYRNYLKNNGSLGELAVVQLDEMQKISPAIRQETISLLLETLRDKTSEQTLRVNTIIALGRMKAVEAIPDYLTEFYPRYGHDAASAKRLPFYSAQALANTATPAYLGTILDGAKGTYTESQKVGVAYALQVQRDRLENAEAGEVLTRYADFLESLK